MRGERGGEIVYFTQKMGKIVFCLSLVGLMGRKQAAVLVAILMEKGGRRRQAWWGQRYAAPHQARPGEVVIKFGSTHLHRGV